MVSCKLVTAEIVVLEFAFCRLGTNGLNLRVTFFNPTLGAAGIRWRTERRERELQRRGVDVICHRRLAHIDVARDRDGVFGDRGAARF